MTYLRNRTGVHPTYPHSLKDKWEGRESLEAGFWVFGILDNCSNCSLNQVFGLVDWQSECLVAGFWFGSLAMLVAL